MPGRAAAGAASSRGAFGNVDAKKNRMAPYSGATRGKAKPGCIGEEEIEKLIKQDEMIEEVKQCTQETTEKLRSLKKKLRDELDACKRENRAGKLNGAEIERVQELGREKAEEVRVVLQCRTSEDRSTWATTNDDPVQREQQERLEASLKEATLLYTKEKAAYDAVIGTKQEAQTEVVKLQAAIKELEEAEIEINTLTSQLEASRATLEAKRDAALRDMTQKEEVVGKVVAQQAETCNQLESATNQRKQMEARVSKMSNNIKGCMWLTAPNERVEISGLKGTEVKIDKKTTFELDSVNVGSMPFKELQVAGTKLLIFVSMEQGLVPADVQKCLEYGLQVVPGAAVSACEVYGDSLRDLLKDGGYQELALVQPDVALDSFDKLKSDSSPDVAAIIKAYDLRATKSQVRSSTSVFFSFKAPGTNLLMLCTPHISKTDADPGHIVSPFVKMHNDPKEAKLMLRRTTIGRNVAQALPEISRVSMIGLCNGQTQPQGVIDVCRLMFRCMMVDLGVRKE